MLSYFTNEEGKSVCVEHEGNIREHASALLQGPEKLKLKLTAFPPNARPVPTCHVVTENTKKIFSWVLETGLFAMENGVYDAQGNESGAGVWSSYGMFVRAASFVCRDIKELLHAMLIHVGDRMLHIMVHSDGLSIATNTHAEHFDLAGNIRTLETSTDVANEAMEVLTQSHGLECGSVVVLILDTRSCELWYIEFFERYFSQFYAVVKIFFADVSRKSLCDPDEVEAINTSYTKLLASLPQMFSVADVKLKTDSAQYLG
ncbi:Hypothetical protein, putative [Bodo saltans]|uniref:Uncharacterized protein n=1 Tax=Bodo saltans TaxID=75058 RepID=A0A0S4J1F4_BODSA|nr:Hypothetical protein, putative [Bodo saltans]|eukprot:CUG44469.1 Hypothetical protein, putative [Bodo saltans]